MPSFLASVAETHSVSCPVRPTRHRCPAPPRASSGRRSARAPGPPTTPRVYNATHKAPGGISMWPQHLVATPLDRKKHPSPRFASPKAITADHHRPCRPPCLTLRPGHGSAPRRRPAGHAARARGAISRRSGVPRLGKSLRRRIHKKRASGREFGKEGLAGDAAAAPADARRRGRARGPPREKLFAPDPAFKPARIATISKDEARSGPTGSTTSTGRRGPTRCGRPAAAARSANRRRARTREPFRRRPPGSTTADARIATLLETPAVELAWR